MRPRLIERLHAQMHAYQDLVEGLPEGALSAELPVPSNTVGAQLWCVVGARESYARALRGGEWAGFSCSLTMQDSRRPGEVLAALGASEAAVGEAAASVVADDWTPRRDDLLIDLLEHESQHQGQLIRYAYGLGFEFPESWRERWTLE